MPQSNHNTYSPPGPPPIINQGGYFNGGSMQHAVTVPWPSAAPLQQRNEVSVFPNTGSFEQVNTPLRTSQYHSSGLQATFSSQDPAALSEEVSAMIQMAFVVFNLLRSTR